MSDKFVGIQLEEAGVRWVAVKSLTGPQQPAGIRPIKPGELSQGIQTEYQQTHTTCAKCAKSAMHTISVRSKLFTQGLYIKLN